MHALPMPGPLFGIYPERATDDRRSSVLPASQLEKLAGLAVDRMQSWEKLDSAPFAAALPDVRLALRRHGLHGDALSDALGYAASAMRRTSGLLPRRNQLHAALAVVDQQLAEMATGEGKTLASALAAGIAALAGVPVHVLTANDYLVTRDAAAFAGFHAALGIDVGCITASSDEDERRATYARDVVYLTARELVFDYLRDRLTLRDARHDIEQRAAALHGRRGETRLRGLCMAIVDEADSLLIDDASTPFVLSEGVPDARLRGLVWQALGLARQLDPTHYRQSADQRITLTEPGRLACATACAGLDGVWRNPRQREDWITQALAALHCYRRDRDYLVETGRIVIVDRNTGRRADGRVWGQGLHALIEAKEGCRISPQARTLAQITYQRFFPRYHRLGGLSGTLHEARRELRRVYGLNCVTIPLHRPSRHKSLPRRLYRDHAALWQAVAERAGALRAAGRPVLIGTDSVAQSEQLASQLTALGIPHRLLNARQNAEEAELIASAGESGQITISTNIAGRGTDIALGAGVAALGGLHVLICQQNPARRLDRQLAGRCARRGEAGSSEIWLALDDNWRGPLAQLAHWRSSPKSGRIRLPDWCLNLWLRLRQRECELRDERIRQHLTIADEDRELGLALAGKGE